MTDYLWGRRAFWSGAAANAVVVEADAFKETDVIYRAISSRGHHNDMLQTAELVLTITAVLHLRILSALEKYVTYTLRHSCF